MLCKEDSETDDNEDNESETNIESETRSEVRRYLRVEEKRPVRVSVNSITMLILGVVHSLRSILHQLTGLIVLIPVYDFLPCLDHHTYNSIIGTLFLCFNLKILNTFDDRAWKTVTSDNFTYKK